MRLWPFKPKPSPPRGLRDILGTIPSSMEFRRDPATRVKALAMLSSPIGHLMLSIARNESPMRVGSVSGAATAEQMARAYGVQEGYEMALLALSMLAEPAPDNTEIPETFTDPLNE